MIHIYIYICQLSTLTIKRVSVMHTCIHAQVGLTALMQASLKGYLEVVKALVAAGADVNATQNVGVCGGIGEGFGDL